MQLIELFRQNMLSFRSLRVCHAHGLMSVEDLRLYLSFYGNFLNLKRCGQKSNMELIGIALDTKVPGMALPDISKRINDHKLELRMVQSNLKEQDRGQKVFPELDSEEWMLTFNRIELFCAKFNRLPNWLSTQSEESRLGIWLTYQSTYVPRNSKKFELLNRLKIEFG